MFMSVPMKKKTCRFDLGKSLVKMVGPKVYFKNTSCIAAS